MTFLAKASLWKVTLAIAGSHPSGRLNVRVLNSHVIFEILAGGRRGPKILGGTQRLTVIPQIGPQASECLGFPHSEDWPKLLLSNNNHPSIE